MPYNFIKSVLNETVSSKKLEHTKLSYKKDALDPVMSEDTINYHYGKLYKTYVERYNEGEGDPEFNEAGAFLHDIFFTQFKEPVGTNNPTGKTLELIETKFKSFDNMKQEFEKTAMAIQGSGWVYLSYKGEIKTIKNHQIRKDILLLIDWWEHAWALDYQADKKGYLKNIWRIIDWSVIESRVG
jgi:Fe-Mn family superoxide dismutase